MRINEYIFIYILLIPRGRKQPLSVECTVERMMVLKHITVSAQCALKTQNFVHSFANAKKYIRLVCSSLLRHKRDLTGKPKYISTTLDNVIFITINTYGFQIMQNTFGEKKM